MQKNPRCAEFYKRTHSPWEGVVSDRGSAAAVPLSSVGTAPGSSREKLLNLFERKQKNFEKAAAAVLAGPVGLRKALWWGWLGGACWRSAAAASPAAAWGLRNV